jgi:hypothetical protein
MPFLTAYQAYQAYQSPINGDIANGFAADEEMMPEPPLRSYPPPYSAQDPSQDHNAGSEPVRPPRSHPPPYTLRDPSRDLVRNASREISRAPRPARILRVVNVSPSPSPHRGRVATVSPPPQPRRGRVYQIWDPNADLEMQPYIAIEGPIHAHISPLIINENFQPPLRARRVGCFRRFEMWVSRRVDRILGTEDCYARVWGEMSCTFKFWLFFWVAFFFGMAVVWPIVASVQNKKHHSG